MRQIKYSTTITRRDGDNIESQRTLKISLVEAIKINDPFLRADQWYQEFHWKEFPINKNL